MATIKAIEGRTVHQIQSGQVIVDLCSVVKELVENSLDAGATSIDIRFKNQGLDAIEVQDNGSGITLENYGTVALKHHTSKLATYEDLTTLTTFGFRGEALSSLCALSRFTVITCLASDAPKGTKLEFEQSGALKGTSVVAAQKGTTVSVENLFHNLPVRRQELQRRIKTEWSRVVGVLGQYACIQTGVKISVSQQTSAKGKKTVLFSTKGNATTRENIVNVFGTKTLTVLLPLDLSLELEPSTGTTRRWTSQQDGGAKEIRVVGHISRPAYGEGRQTPDRQMFFVNSRPCGLPQVAKAFNEVYRSYNSTQSPFIFANITMDTHMYDVNVSPDKRTILLHDQTRMLEELKTSLTNLFETQDYTVPISQLSAQKLPAYKQLTIQRQSSTISESRSETATSVSETPRSVRQDSEEPNREYSRSRTTPVSRDESIEDENEDFSRKEKHDAETRRGATSHGPMLRDQKAMSLVSIWLGKKTRDRPDMNPVDTETVERNENANVTSKSKLNLIEKFSSEAAAVDSAIHATQSTESTDATDQDVRTGDLHAQQQDSSHAAQKVDHHPEELSQHDIIAHMQNEALTEEEPIPSLKIPAKRMVPPSSPFNTSPRPRRTAETMATITIGEDTITSSLGTPFPKRQRVSEPRVAPLTKTVLPSFGSRLSQRFAAGTQLSDEAEEKEELVTPREVVLCEDKESIDYAQQEVQGDEDDDDERGDEESAGQSSSELSNGAAGDEIVEDEQDHDADDLPEDDSEYVDEEEKKAREDARVQEMIKAAEDTGNADNNNEKRAMSLLKGRARKKDATVHLELPLSISTQQIFSQVNSLAKAIDKYETAPVTQNATDVPLDADAAEDKLSLTINKSDFAKMKIVGQFNLGFILAMRAAEPGSQAAESSSTEDLFIIDQHASDEKYNFERLQNSTTVQSQRLVQPKTLDLTAVEEEVVMENLPALATNGFIVTVDESGSQPVGSRCQLVSLPLSKETTFSLRDLEELISLLSEAPTALASNNATVIRPSKVRKMFAMRACRSSIMIGKTLTKRKMREVVRHMGEIDKPWNCPHGRPTMRHLCGLGRWDESGWKEGDGLADEDEEDRGREVDWAGWLNERRGG